MYKCVMSTSRCGDFSSAVYLLYTIVQTETCSPFVQSYSKTLNKHRADFYLCSAVVYCTLYRMTHLQVLSKKIITVITEDIARLPGGYAFWQRLPEKGKRSGHVVTRRWATYIIQTCFPASLLQAMTLACLSSDGLPTAQGDALRRWLIQHVYHGDAAQLYIKWASLNQLALQQTPQSAKDTPHVV